jgi:hypothetical protein
MNKTKHYILNLDFSHKFLDLSHTLSKVIAYICTELEHLIELSIHYRKSLTYHVL